MVIAVAFAYQRSRLGRQLRASREDPLAARGVGVHVHRQRLWAFTLSGALAGLAGGLLVHQLGSITTDSVYLELTFLTLAMLVFGGIVVFGLGSLAAGLATSAGALIAARAGMGVGGALLFGVIAIRDAEIAIEKEPAHRHDS